MENSELINKRDSLSRLITEKLSKLDYESTTFQGGIHIFKKGNIKIALFISTREETGEKEYLILSIKKTIVIKKEFSEYTEIPICYCDISKLAYFEEVFSIIKMFTL